MKLLAIVPFALVGCNGPDGTDGNPPDVTAGPPTFAFKSSVPAAEYIAEVEPRSLEAHRATNMLAASVGVVMADVNVQDQLNINGGGTPLPPPAAAVNCWVTPEHPQFSFEISYENCSASFQMDGGVFINNHPSGPLLFEFSDFTIQDRKMGGVLAFDTRSAFPSPLYWQIYGTDADGPGLDELVQLGINVDGQLSGLAIDGGANIDFTSKRWSLWGTGVVAGDPEITVIMGGTEPLDVPADDPPGASAISGSLDWLECRCPTQGVTTLDMPLNISAVFIDIDDLEDTPDDFDDIELEVPVNVTVDGIGELTPTACGAYDVVYNTQATTIPVPVDQIVARISFACDTLAIDDPERCQALIRAAADLDSDTFNIEISQEDLNETARAAVAADFDTTWCEY